MNGILCRKSRTEYCDCMSTYLSPGILKIKWVHPRYMYQARRRGGSKGSNEPPLKFDNGGLKYK